MKRFILFVCLSLLLLLATAQTPWAKNALREKMVSLASAYGVDLEIQTIHGRLPLEWKLQNVRIKKSGFPPLFCEELKIRLQFLPLLIGQVNCSHIRIYGGIFKEIPFQAHGHFRLKKNIEIYAEGEGFSILGKSAFSNPQTSLQFTCNDFSKFKSLFPIALEGSCAGDLLIDSTHIHAEIRGEDLKVSGISLSPTHLTLNAEPCKEGWQGALDVKGGQLEIPLSLHVVFSLPHSLSSIHFEEVRLVGPGTSIKGSFHGSSHLTEWVGALSGYSTDLKAWRPLWPESKLSGELRADASMKNGQFTSALKLKHLNCQKMQWENLELQTEWIRDCGSVILKGEKGSFEELFVSKLEATSYIKNKTIDFSLEVNGKWKEALELICLGQVNLDEKKTHIQIPEFYGFALKKAFYLKDPLSIEWTPQHFKLHPFNFEMGDGTLTARLDLNEETSLINADAHEFPLELIAIPFPHLSIKGIGGGHIDLIGWKKNLQGSCHILIDRAEITPYGRPSPIRTKGAFQMHFDEGRAQVHALLRSEADQVVDFSGSFPIVYEPMPLHLWLDPSNPLSAELITEVDFENLLHFVNIGPQHLEGRLSTRLLFSNQGLSGEIELQNGLYENYVSGSVLKDISIRGTATKQKIFLHSITAVDDNKQGSLEGHGEIQLQPDFSYFLDTDLQNFQVIADQMIVGRAGGHLRISGDKNGALAKGELELAETNFHIPDRLPVELPDLKVTFVNPPDVIKHKEKIKSRSPFLLDLDINTPHQFFVEGRGLNCELKGRLHLSGTYTSLAARGTLSLVKGDYLFCGKVFNLTQAELLFKDKPSPSASVTLSGNCELSDATATVAIRGPLSSPNLFLQSNPQLPTSALLARLLFNQDISEISPLQAFQLAQTLLSISGSSGPSDIFEKVRKTLHIDRFNLLTSENDPGKISLQIGKYLMRGVLLTLAQGASSRNVTLEIELMRGFTLQAAMNEKQQGKFSLKWHHHY